MKLTVLFHTAIATNTQPAKRLGEAIGNGLGKDLVTTGAAKTTAIFGVKLRFLHKLDWLTLENNRLDNALAFFDCHGFIGKIEEHGVVLVTVTAVVKIPHADAVGHH